MTASQVSPDDAGDKAAVAPAGTLWHQKPAAEAAAGLGVDAAVGLTYAEATIRLAAHGPNELFGHSGPSALKLLLSNLLNAMNIILGIALIFSAAVLQDWAEVGILAAVIVTNTGIGFYQEFNSEKTMEALRAMSSPTAHVRREGNADLIPCREVVPGDIVFLEEGSIVPADVRITEAVNLQIEEAILTGESVPVSKHIGVVADAAAPLGDRKNMAFKNTLVSRGRGVGIVVTTGLRTEIGKIALSVMGSTNRNDYSETHLLENSSVLADAPAGENGADPAGKPKPRKQITLRGLWTRAKAAFKLDVLRTPLQATMDKMMLTLVGCAVILAVIVFASNNFQFQGYVILYAVGVAVAILPEGLPAVVTVTMALGVRRMAQQKAIVRKLAALEALGQVTNICSDKTGTLTQGKMLLKFAWLGGRLYSVSGEGIEPKGELCEIADLENGKRDAIDVSKITDSSLPCLYQALLVSTLCNTASLAFDVDDKRWKSTGDPTEVALEVFAQKLGFKRDDVKEQHRFASELPFDSVLKRMTVAYYRKRGGDRDFEISFHAKGSTESILSISINYADEKGAKHELTQEFRDTVSEEMLKMSGKGMRVLALAYKTKQLTRDQTDDDALFHEKIEYEYRYENREAIEAGFTFLGLVAIYDPPRASSAEAVSMCHEAGIEVHMATGDHPSTAVSIAREIGILPKSELTIPEIMQRRDLAITAVEFEKLTDEEIDRLPSLPRVLARCSPESKVRLIAALHRRGKFVAMTGDGVNDAPAVKKADIGIAMGLGGSDVTKQASEITLTDDNFVTILRAVSEGRAIFANIQKFTLHLLSGNVSEVIALIIGLALRDADNKAILPMSSIQILWLNMITSSPIALALGMEKAASDVMKQPPRSQKTSLFTKELIADTLVYGAIMGVLTLVSFIASSRAGTHWETTRLCYDHTLYDKAACAGIFASRTTAFFSLSFMLLLHGLNCRHTSMSIFSMTWDRDCRWLVYAVIGGFVLVVPTAYIPGFDYIFYHGPISWEWGIIAAVLVGFMASAELYKLCKRRFAWFSKA